MKRVFLIIAAMGFAAVGVQIRRSLPGDPHLPILIPAMLGLVVVSYLLWREWASRRAQIDPAEANRIARQPGAIRGAILKGAGLGALAGLASLSLAFMVLAWPPSPWWGLLPVFVMTFSPVMLSCAIVGATLFYAGALRRRREPMAAVAWVRLWGGVGLGVAAAAAAALFLLPEREGRELYDIHAAADKVAFVHSVGDHQFVVVHDLATQATDVFASAGRPVTTPRFAGPSSLLVPLAPKVNPPFSLDQVERDGALYACDLNRKTCSPILHFPGKISDPVLGKDGEVVFVGAEPQLAGDSRPDRPSVGYRSHDIYVGAGSRSRARVTNEHSPALYSLSFGGGTAAFGLSRRAATKDRVTSEIYCARVDEALAPVDFQADTAKPCVTVGKDKDTHPTISPDGRFLAFNSVSESIKGKGWRYDIVVARRETGEVMGRIIPSGKETRTLSRPVFVSSTRIRFIELVRDDYVIKSFDIGAGQARTDGRLSVDSIEAIKTIHAIDAAAP